MRSICRTGTTTPIVAAALGILLVLVSCSAEPPGPRFRRVTAGDLPDVGKSFGATWADIDGDGKKDLCLGRHGLGVGLYLDRPGLRFERADSCTFLPCHQFDQHGAAAADCDGDGDWDLYITVGADRGEGVGPNELWQRDAGGVFRNTIAADHLLADLQGRGRGAFWFALDRDRHLELVVLNYRSPARLYGFDGKTWTDLAGRIMEIAPTPSGRAIRPVAEFRGGLAVPGDLDGDDYPDLIIYEPKLTVLRNNNGRELLVTPGEGGLVHPDVGLIHAALGDVDNDGDLDLVWADRRPGRLEVWLNRSVAGIFSFTPGPDLSHLPCSFELDTVLLADFDNDGILDLFVMMQGKEFLNTPDLVARGLGNGDFTPATGAWGNNIPAEGLPRGAWPLDLDRDGDLDLMLIHGKGNFPDRHGLTVLYENTCRTPGLTVELETGTGPPHALGAVVELTTADGRQTRRVRSLVNHWNSTVLPTHFGVGDAEGPFEVRVTWTSGRVGNWELPRAGRAYRLREGDPVPGVLVD